MGFSKRNIEHINRTGKTASRTIVYINQGNGVVGADGAPGVNGLNIYLDHAQHTFESNSDGIAVLGQTDRVKIVAFSGTDRLCTYVDTSTGIDGLIQDVLDASIENQGTTENNVVFTIDSSLYESTGNIEIPILIYTEPVDEPIGDSSAWYDPNPDIISFSLLYSWAVNAVGQSSYRLDLSNERMNINCDSSGNFVHGSVLPTCKATLYYGTDEVPNATYFLSSPANQNLSGVSIDASGNLIFYDSSLGFSGNSIELTITAKISNQTYGLLIGTLVKNLPGKDGQSPVNYWLVLTCDAVHVNPNTTTLVADPSTVGASCYKQVGIETPVVASDAVIKYDYNSSTPTTTYTSTITIDPSKSYISFGAYVNNVLVDGIETIPILKDGVNGQSAYRLDLTNENAGINADASGNILSGAVRPSCTATLYCGNDVMTGVEYSISTTATGVTINSSTGVLTFASNFTFSGTSVEITVTAKIGTTIYGTAIMTVSKNIAGKDGSTGGDAITYWLELSADSVLVDVNNNNSYTPTSIKVKAMKQVGANTPTTASDASIYYAYDSTPTSSSSSVSNDSSINITITNHFNLNIALHAGGTQRDIETIPILRNGLNGTQGTQGAQGYSGIVYRRSVWDPSSGRVYRNDSSLNTYGIRYIDQCFNMDNTLVSNPDLKFYQCIQTHEASTGIPLTNTSYWEEISITQQFYSENIFSHQISADVIDVDDLVVKNVYSKDGNFYIDSSGNMQANAGNFFGNIRIPLTTISKNYTGSSSYYNLASSSEGLGKSNFIISYGTTTSSDERYVIVQLPTNSSSYNGYCWTFIAKPMPSRHVYQSSDQLPGFRVQTASGSKFYDYSSLSGADPTGCSRMQFGPGLVRILSDGENYYVIESSASVSKYYLGEWHANNALMSPNFAKMELSGSTLILKGLDE